MNNTIKFNTIVYKLIQKKLGLDLNDFKRFSGRYIEESSFGIKEYSSNDNRLIYDGEYGNKKRNGLGKEYNENDKLIFIGEYLDGKKWKGIYYEYDEDTGNLIFECHYINGKIEGEAKEYDKYLGELIFSGNYLNEKRNGNGTEYKSILLEKSEKKNIYYAYSSKKIIIKKS